MLPSYECSPHKFATDTFEEYLSQMDWRTKENSNTSFSLGTLNKYAIGKMSALYWESLYEKIDPKITQGHRSGDYHIHDFSSYSSYCFGASLMDLLLKGIQGVDNISISTPARRLRSITAQIANIVTIFQNEIAGAVAFSSWNVYLAPFVYYDALNRRGISPLGGAKIDLQYGPTDLEDIRQSVESMVYQLNSNSRMGSEPAFSNLTLDFDVLGPMKKQAVIYHGKLMEHVYGDFKKEADILLEVFTKTLLKGDGQGKPFAYPIPTYNIGKSMDWEKYEYVFELAAKTGVPYFGNFVHGSLKEEDVYSMCCRLRLDKRELKNKTGGLFGAAEKTGSIGVFTINLPAIGYRNRGLEWSDLFRDLEEQMALGYKQLKAKMAFIKKEFERGLFPALKTYLGQLDNLFLTIGIVGGNELCLNYLGKGIDCDEGRELMIRILHRMRERLSDFQQESGHLFNLEFTPAESAAYRLAMKDKARYPDIITAGTEEAPYYTNSVHLPVSLDWNYDKIYKHQNGLLSLATGGSVLHNYLREPTTTEVVKTFLKASFSHYDIPYISFSPMYSVCPEDGFLAGKFETCPHCQKETDIYQRVTGYVRPIKNFNKGKAQEFKERSQKSLCEDGLHLISHL